jgi:hypothetical protein
MLANEAIWNCANQLENRLSKSDCCTVEFWTCCFRLVTYFSIIASSSSTSADLTMADPGELRERKRSDFTPSLVRGDNSNNYDHQPPEQSTCTTLTEAPHVEASASRTDRPSRQAGPWQSSRLSWPQRQSAKVCMKRLKDTEDEDTQSWDQSGIISAG